jgi:hypothetical protein
VEFSFPDSDTKAVTDKIMTKLGGRELGKMVAFNPTPDGIEVVISKLGTSKLKFSKTENNGHSIFKLIDEKIAFSHRAFKGEVQDKMRKIILQAGGSVGEG